MKRVMTMMMMVTTAFTEAIGNDKAGDDQTALAEIIKNDENVNVRLAAIDKLTDQTVLADFAKNGRDLWVRNYAVAKLNVQDNKTLLEEISRNDECLQIRLTAMFKLEDPIVSAEFEKHINIIGRSSPWMRKRETVDDVPQDQGQLAEVARNDKDKCVRITAVKRLTDQAILADVAKNDKDWLVRWFAISKLDNQALLAEFAENEKDIVVRKEAAERLGLIKQNEPHPDFIGHGGTLAEIVEIIEKRRKAKQEEEEGK